MIGRALRTIESHILVAYKDREIESDIESGRTRGEGEGEGDEERKGERETVCFLSSPCILSLSLVDVPSMLIPNLPQPSY